MTELALMSGGTMAGLIRAGELGTVEAADYFIDRIERLDARTNAVAVADFDRARQAAKAPAGGRIGGFVRPPGPLRAQP